MPDKTGKKKILVIDGDEISLEIAKIMLRNDYEVITAKSGKIASELLGHFRYGFIPDLVLLDTMTPFTGGRAAFRKIKGTGGSKKEPLIFLTALKGIERQKLAEDIEADGYIEKPYSKDDLLNKIKSAMENKAKQEPPKNG
jgi:DNA-binding response OmpR family regulator